MAIRTQVYRPDTCGCVVVESWDDAIPAEQRINSLQSVVQRCSFHAAVIDPSLYGIIREENLRKNKALEKALEFAAANPNMVTCTYDAGRTLTITFLISVPQNKKDQLQQWCDTNLGVGKVVVA